MPQRSTSRRKSNLFDWARSKTTYKRSRGEASHTAQAYRAGLKSGDTGEFDIWMRRQRFTPDSSTRKRLEEQYRRGVERSGDAERVKAKRAERAAAKKEQKQQKQTALSSYKGVRLYKLGGGEYTTSIDRDSRFDSLRDAKDFIGSWKSNPTCARTRKEKVSDRAKRYRANQPGCKPVGVRKCKLCRATSDLMVDHIDGNESNGRKSNLRWLCRSCNTLLGAEMAKTGEGRRTVQYNPASGGAKTLGEYMQAVLQHTRGAHDEGGKIIHATPKSRRREFASEIWRTRSARAGGSDAPDWVTNPAASAAQYRLAQAVLSGTAHEAMPRRIAQEIVDRTPARDRSIFMMGSAGGSTETAANPEDLYDKIQEHLASGGVVAVRTSMRQTNYSPKHAKMFRRPSKPSETGVYVQRGKHWDYVFPEYIHYGRYVKNPAALSNPSARTSERNQPIGDDSEEYKQASRTAELFHGRPVKEEIEVTESIKTHDWYVAIGPLVKLIIKPVTKKPKKKVPLPFHQSEAGTVQLFCSPDGRQFYLRGGDQELDLDAFAMGEGTRWFRDHMLIGEAVEITYRDRKKFHSFKLTDYFHKLGEETGEKPTLAYDSLSQKLSIIGGAYRVEMDDLVDDMSPGIVN